MAIGKGTAALALVAALATTGCSGSRMSMGGMFSPAPAPVAVAAQPAAPVVTTVGGIQQFAVPADGRALMAQRLAQLVPGPLSDAQISNAWRTTASAAATPNDYAACVSATSAAGTQTFMVVKSGGGTGDVVSGAAAAKRCSDGSRVVQWVELPEALGARG